MSLVENGSASSTSGISSALDGARNPCRLLILVQNGTRRAETSRKGTSLY